MINSIKHIGAELCEALGEMVVVLDTGEEFHVVYYIDNEDEWHFFYEDGKKPDYIDFEYELMCCI